MAPRPDRAPNRLVLTGHGAPAREVLWALVADLRAGDPLAPVTVAVPSTYAGLALRRVAGRRLGGLVNVRFLSLNRVAELLGAPFLAAPGRVPLTATRRAGAIRAALDHDGPFRALATHPATTRAFAATLVDLDLLPDDALERVAATGARAAEVVAIAQRVRALVAGTYTEEDQLRAAAAMVADGTADLRDLGPLICFAPRRLSPGSVALVRALARAGAATGGAAAVLALTGDAAADGAMHELAAHLAPELGPVQVDLPSAAPVGHRILSCADADDEARVVVRDIARRVEAGEPLHRMAIAYRNAVPYARLLHEHLGAAGIPVHGPRPAMLRESVAGRSLLALLHLSDGTFARDDVATLLASGPLRERPRGGLVPGPHWDRISCRANVVSGLPEWRSRLERFAVDKEAKEAWKATEAGTLFASETHDPQADAARRLIAFIDDLAVNTAPPSGTWRALAAWAVSLLDRYVTPVSGELNRWPAAELKALELVRERVGALAQLDELGAPASTQSFLRAVDDELDGSTGYGGSFGDGVLVASLESLRATDYDTVFVVGLVEGAFPPPPRDDPLLSERARASVSGLTRRADTAASERADYLAALAAGAERVITAPRADRRAQRAARPAPWLLETASRLAGRPVLATELDPGHPTARDAPWLELVASFEAALEHAPAAGTLQEHHLQGLLAWKAARRPLGRHPLTVRYPELRLGFTSIRARARRTLSPWEGVIGSRPGLAPSPDRILSPTSLEHWAHCPFRYFLSRVLHIDELERPEARERLSGADRGTIIHDVLQEFIATYPRTSPDQPWSPEERAALRAIGEIHCDAAQADGLTGRAVWWNLDRARILRELDAVLETDEWARANDQTIPWAFELGFGSAGDPLPAITIDLPDSEPVRFRGRIDRVDRSPDGSRYVVYDYKTGMPNDLTGITDDPVMRGRRLQLAIYANAIQRAHPDVEVGAHYWFTREQGNAAFAGFILGDAEHARLTDALHTIVTAVGAGQFPAYPGADGFFGPDNCKWCAFDRLCPQDRARRFERRRDDPALDAITSLAEQEWAPEAHTAADEAVEVPL